MIHLKTIKEHALGAPSACAFVHHSQIMTWLDFQSATENKVNFLLSRYGTDFPKQACYISPNRIDLMPWLAAFATLGIPVTGLDYTLPVDMLSRLCHSLQAEFILISTKFVGEIGEIASMGPQCAAVFDLDSLSIPYTNAVWNRPAGELLDHLKELSLPNMPFRAVGLTSGTTGLPKLVIRSRSFDQRRFAYFTERYMFNRADRFLLSMPLYHAAGNGWVRLFLNLGATIFIAEIDVPNTLATVLISQACTVSVMTPVLLEQLLNVIAGRQLQQSIGLRWLLIGGKHFPVALKKRALDILGPVVYEYYGTTETGVNTIAEPGDLESSAGCVGKAYDGNAIAIVDSAGRRLPPLTIGSVAIDSYMNMDSYGDGAASELELDGCRYLRTPEQGYLDEQGLLFLMNRSGNLDCAMHLYRLEDAIRNLPCISDVAIMQSGTDLDCVVSLKSEANDHSKVLQKIQELSRLENIAFARCRLVSSIPYSPSGKVRLTDLASLLAA